MTANIQLIKLFLKLFFGKSINWISLILVKCQKEIQNAI